MSAGWIACVVATSQPQPLEPPDSAPVLIVTSLGTIALNATGPAWATLGNTASVKAVARNFVDYLHVGKVNGEWKIVNVLWEMAPRG